MAEDSIKNGSEKASREDEIQGKWDNYANNQFYEEVGVKGLGELATLGGLASGCDVKLLKPYWENAKSLLEVGAGYGRTIDILLEEGFQGEITAIERAEVFFHYLKKNYAGKVRLLQEDIHDCENIIEQYDVIFFLWYILAEFPAVEQLVIIKKIVRLLKKNGIFILDIIPENVFPLSAEKIGPRSFRIFKNHSSISVYLPTEADVLYYAQMAKLSIVDILKIKTDTKRDRLIFILKKF